MSLPTTPIAVVPRLRSLTVATMATLCRLLGVSAVTVARALRRHGYLTSFNHNSAFYTLADTPRFDADGLWWHGDVGFSRHRTLQATLRALVERAPAGCTADHLQQRLATPVGNLLARLVARGLLGRMALGRHAVYLAADPRLQAQQRARRDHRAAQAAAPRPPGPPADWPVPALLELLLQLLRTPAASPASLARALQARGLAVSADHVRSAFEAYGLKKSWAPWPCLSSSPS